MIVRWLEDALDELADYIATDHPAAAARIFVRIEQLADGLASFPEHGRPGRCAGTRELVVTGTPDVVAYRITGDTIDILRVLHGRRLWPDSFGDPPPGSA